MKNNYFRHRNLKFDNNMLLILKLFDKILIFMAFYLYLYFVYRISNLGTSIIKEMVFYWLLFSDYSTLIINTK